MSTDIDGSLPSVTLDPDGDERSPPGSTWLQDEMRRRMAAAAGSGGRHARRGPAEPAPSSADYVPRHAGPAPGPPVPRPRPPRPDASLPGIRPVTPTGDGPASGPAVARRVGGELPPPRSGPTVGALGGPGGPSLYGPLVRRRRPEPPSATAAARLLNSPTPPVAPPVVSPVRPAPGPAGGPVVPAPSARTAATIDAPAPAVLLPPGPAAVVGGVAPTVVPPADLVDRPLDDPDRRRDLTDGELTVGELTVGELTVGDLDDGDLDDGDLDDGDLDDGDLLDLDDLPVGPGGERILWSATPPPPARLPPAPFPGPGRVATLAVADRRVPGVVVFPTDVDAVDPEPGADTATGAVRIDEPATDGRTRVVLSERQGSARPVRNVVELQEGGTVGDLLRRNLIGSQLTVALRFAIGGGLVLLLLPALFWLSPATGLVSVLGVRLPWLLLGVGAYPFLFGLGLWFTRTAERAEKNFADQVQDS